ncbi:putative cysteine peptidase [Metamycoplasma canadense]|uniref:Uncharacterized protein n=1 Tax=Metamycoplasma canadense TaxID=29554 RepID=A0A077L6V1_9BACT|nr:hypothetical protein [Metamycoplasma canadense]BAP39747.1 hypothetical protein MCAN360_0702 [Metamycoplasma canadense]
MKIKKILNYLHFLSVPLISLSVPLISSTKGENKFNQNNIKKIKDFLIETEKNNVDNITKKDNKLIYSKIIKDLTNRKILMIIFDNCNSFVDLETMQTLEINFEHYNLEILKKNEITYISLGEIYFKKSNDFLLTNILTNQEINVKNIYLTKAINISDDKIKDVLKKNLNFRKKIKSKNISFKSKDYGNNLPISDWKNSRELNVSTQVPFSWWFATRDSISSAGYDQLGNYGLCEYVALSQLLLYTELFIRPDIFDYEQYNHYIFESNSDNLYYSSPEFKYHYWNSTKKSLTYDLFKMGGEYLNLKTGNYYEYIVKQFIKNKEVLNELEFPHKFGGYYRAWESVKNGIPAILGVATLGGFNHAMIVYGYDDNSDMFLSSKCFGNSKENRILYSYYTKVWGSYYFSIKLKENKEFNNFKKAFIYNEKKFSGNEINEMLKDHNYEYKKL